MSWEPPCMSILFTVVSVLWWCFNRQPSAPRSPYSVLGLALAALLAVLVDSRHQALRQCLELRDAVAQASLTEQLSMILFLVTSVWLLHRSWQTLWRPVPELVSILRVETPEAPDVCLSGIGPDTATLGWSKPASARPVKKYLLQVNGIHVGESPGNETAITVTGLRPSHFYNLRVVAVGPNNFRTGSSAIRLRTFAKDGRPELGGSRLPNSFDPDCPGLESRNEGSWPDMVVSSLRPADTAPSSETSAVHPRDLNAVASVSRRNTLNRRHSPSVATFDQPRMTRPSSSADPEMTLTELNDRFEAIRKEIDDTLASFAKDKDECQLQEEELKKDKDRKRQLLREKEELTAQLKTTARATMEQMRTTDKERTKKEHQLRERESKKAKVRESAIQFGHDVERMSEDRQGFMAHKKELSCRHDCDTRKLDKTNAELQANCVELEADLKDKGKQLQDVKNAGTTSTALDADRWRDEDLKLKRKWEQQRRDMHNRLLVETKDGQALSQQVRDLTEQLSKQHQAGHSFYHRSALDFEPSSVARSGRRAHSGNSLPQVGLNSPNHGAQPEPDAQGGSGFNSGSRPPGVFLGAKDGHLHPDAEPKAPSGPLSPSAQTLLPSNIFEESEETDLMHIKNPLTLEQQHASDEFPQSPASSNLSFKAFPSPHSSAHNLAFPQHQEHNEGSPYRVVASPQAIAAAGHKISGLLSSLHLGRASRSSDRAGASIGSVKPVQSQLLPTADENEALASRRGNHLPSWIGQTETTTSSGHFAASRPHSALRLNPITGQQMAGAGDRELEGSRPASIASADLPRPSTESTSIWGTPSDALALQKNRLWSPGDGRWSSRSRSRRPSIQGSNVLTTTLASADDKILDETDLMNPQTMPSQVGVIGSRPKSMNQRLNPAAPTFMANIFKKDRDRSKDKGKGNDLAPGSNDAVAQSHDNWTDGPPASRYTPSVHTQTSLSESHESLPLDVTPSNGTPDPAGPHGKEAEKTMRKLFRKGSSGKFSLSSRLGKETSLFKKGSGSPSNSERMVSADRRSSMEDADDTGDDVAVLGRSYESAVSSTSTGPPKSRESKESGRKSSWRFSMSKMKMKGRDSPAKDKGDQEMDEAPNED